MKLYGARFNEENHMLTLELTEGRFLNVDCLKGDFFGLSGSPVLSLQSQLSGYSGNEITRHLKDTRFGRMVVALALRDTAWSTVREIVKKYNADMLQLFDIPNAEKYIPPSYHLKRIIEENEQIPVGLIDIMQQEDELNDERYFYERITLDMIMAYKFFNKDVLDYLSQFHIETWGGSGYENTTLRLLFLSSDGIWKPFQKLVDVFSYDQMKLAKYLVEQTQLENLKISRVLDMLININKALINHVDIDENVCDEYVSIEMYPKELEKLYIPYKQRYENNGRYIKRRDDIA